LVACIARNTACSSRGDSRAGSVGAMRVAPERDHVLGRQRPMHQMALRQVAETLRRAPAAVSDDNESPLTSTVPLDDTRPASARSRVVFPAPFGPTNATSCPEGNDSETSCRTVGPTASLRAAAQPASVVVHATPPPSARRSRTIR
jgi:hypothetical protein